MATITVFIDGADRSTLVDRTNRLSYSRDINGQGSARFTLADSPSGFVPDDGMEVLIKEDGVDRFGGIIDGRPRGFRGPDSPNQLTFYEISVASWEQRFNKRHVWRTYEDELFEDIVADLNTNFLDGEGFTLNVLAGSAITITFNGETIADALDKLCSEETDGRIWYSTVPKVLTVDIQTGTLAPAVLSAVNVELNNPRPTIEPDRTGYANRITVVGGNPDLPILYTAEDAGEIAARAAIEVGSSGIYHDAIEDAELVTAGQVQQRAEGILQQRKQIRRRFRGMTDEVGFEVGQTVTIDLVNLDIDVLTEDFLIVGVETVVSPGVRALWHTIDAVDGPVDGSWQSEYRRNIKPRTIPMQIEASPGLVRVLPEAGPLCHDPEREPGEWFQGALSGLLDSTPSAIGLLHRRESGTGSGNFAVTLRRDTVPAPDEQVMETWAIDEAEKMATSPTRIARWEEFAGNANFKDRLVVAPNMIHAVGVQYGSPGKLFIVHIWGGGLRGSVDSNLSAQANMGRPVWVGNYVYIPNVSDGELHIYRMTDPTAPVEITTFTSSLSALLAVLVSPDEETLYLIGTEGITSVDIVTDPESPGPLATTSAVQIDVVAAAGTYTRAAGDFGADGYVAGQTVLFANFANGGNNVHKIIDTVAGAVITVTDITGLVNETGSGDETADAIEDDAIVAVGSYVDAAISDDGLLIAAASRIDGSNVRILAVAVAGTALTLTAETSVALATGQMDGYGAMLLDGSLIVWNARDTPPSGADSFAAHVFDLRDTSAPTFTATLTYSHGAAGNIGPAVTDEGRKALFTFGFNTDAQITFGNEAYDKIVPYTIGAPIEGPATDDSLPPRFGGKGITEYVPGNVTVAVGRATLDVIDPPGGPQVKLVADLAAAGQMAWELENSAFHNGSFHEAFDALATSDGATVTMSLEKQGGGDLTMQFSDGLTDLDCTPALTIALTAGSDVSPTENFVYILASDKVLTVSTADWPTEEHNKIAYFLVPSAGFVQADGCYINQNWNDFLAGSDSQGHMLHMAEAIRLRNAVYHKGIAGNGTTEYLTITGGSPDTIHFKSTAGVIYQLHAHTYTAKDTSVSDKILVANDSVAAYDEITDVADLLTDAAGGSMSGKYFNLVFWGVNNKSGEFDPVMVNLPGGSYNKQSDAEQDMSGHDVFAMPAPFGLESTTGFLIARVTLRHQAAGGGTWTHISTLDLRGVSPAAAVGGSTGVTTTEFADNVFRIHDEADVTKELSFQVSGIAMGTTRELTVPDGDGTLIIATGLAGGQALIGGIDSGDDLILVSTAHVTKGLIFLGASGDSYFDEDDGKLVGQIASGNVAVDWFGKDATNGPAVRLTNFSDGNTHIGSMSFRKARGTAAVPTAVQAGNQLGAFFFHAHDGVAFIPNVAAVECRANENHGVGDGGTRMSFGVTADGATVRGVAFTATAAKNLRIGTGSTDPTGSKGIIFEDGTALSSLPSNTAGLYGDDVSGTVEMFAVDEAGNAAQLTPHNFELFDPDDEDPYPWTDYYRNPFLGVEIGVNLARLARLVEQLTGEKITHLRQLPPSERQDWVDHQESNMRQDMALWDEWLAGEQDEEEPPAPVLKAPPPWLQKRLENKGLINAAKAALLRDELRTWKTDRSL